MNAYKTTRNAILPLALITLMLVMTGCQSARIGEPLTDTLGGADFEQQMAFWHELNERPITSNDEAFHALLLYFDGSATEHTYADRVTELKLRRWLPDDFNEDADVAVRRGTLAVALAQALEIEGGVVMRLTGPTPRYATRELVYLNLFPASTAQQTFSGAQFVGVIGRVEDYQRRQEHSRQQAEPAPEEDMPADVAQSR
ncbi:MAG: hypothetical protein WD294_05750 [Phycisphaeraceae bacterium]